MLSPIHAAPIPDAPVPLGAIAPPPRVPIARLGDHDRRFSMRATVELVGGDLPLPTTAETANLSRSGMFVAMTHPPPVGCWLLFELVLGHDPEDRVRGMGTVAWRRSWIRGQHEPPGMGFEFRFLSQDGAAQLIAALENP